MGVINSPGNTNISAVTGTLPIANGGTNSTTALNNNRVIVSSSSKIQEASAITASRAIISDSNGLPTHSTATSTELALLSGKTSVQDGSKFTNWASATFTGSWSANTTYVGFQRRVGDVGEFFVEIQLAGAPTSAALTVTLPNSLVIDTAKLPSTSTNMPVGTSALLDSGTAHYPSGQVLYASTTTVAVLYGVNSPTVGAAVTQAAPFTFANNDRVWVEFKVPISGWTF